MRARRLLPGILPLTLGALACGGGEDDAPPELRATPGAGISEMEALERARELQEHIITIDTHDDIPPDFGSDEVNPCGALDRQVDVPKMKEGGLDVAFFIVYVGQTERTPEAYERARQEALRKFRGIHRVAEELCPGEIQIAYAPDDLGHIVESGKLATVIGIENGFVIGKDLSLLKTYHDLGGRYITLAHGGHNDIADSATPRENLGDAEAEWGGLSPFGEEVVAEMNRLGIMVDVSHISKDAALDAMRVSRAPVIASHSSVRALADHPRNMDDETLDALEANGGVIQIVALDSYVKVEPPEKTAAVDALRQELGFGRGAGYDALSDSLQEVYRARMAEIEARWPGPTLEDFVDHVDYAVGRIGIDHVGISSDFDGGGGIEGWNDASETVNVTAALIRRGYTDEEIAKLWGGNLLRVWREVDRMAAGG